MTVETAKIGDDIIEGLYTVELERNRVCRGICNNECYVPVTPCRYCVYAVCVVGEGELA